MFAITYLAETSSFDYFLLLGFSSCFKSLLLFLVKGTTQSEESSNLHLKIKTCSEAISVIHFLLETEIINSLNSFHNFIWRAYIFFLSMSILLFSQRRELVGEKKNVEIKNDQRSVSARSTMADWMKIMFFNMYLLSKVDNTTIKKKKCCKLCEYSDIIFFSCKCMPVNFFPQLRESRHFYSSSFSACEPKLQALIHR